MAFGRRAVRGNILISSTRVYPFGAMIGVGAKTVSNTLSLIILSRPLLTSHRCDWILNPILRHLAGYRYLDVSFL